MRTWVFTRSEEGLLFGAWTWALAVPVFCGALAILGAGVVLYRSTDLPRGEAPISFARVFLWLGVSLFLCVGVSAVAFFWPAHEATDDEMAYSIQKGEWVWVLPLDSVGEPGLGRGDVVMLTDPLDSSRRVLRRIVAGPGQTVAFPQGELKVQLRGKPSVMNEKPLTREGSPQTWSVMQEVLHGTPPSKLVEEGKKDKVIPGEKPGKTTFLTYNWNQTVLWDLSMGLPDEVEAEESTKYRITVPEGHWYVMADDRDVALDSRWWGPIPEEALLGVVRLHRAEPDLWREEWQVLRPLE